MPQDTPMLPAQLTPVLPLQDPPSSSSVPPSLPPTYTTAGTDQSWTVTRHIFAAAYPRSRIGSYVEAQTGEAHEIGSRKTKAEVEKQVEAIRERQYSAQLQGETESGHLWLAVNCYRRKRRQPAGVTRPQTGTTLITAHATGLHKETWEPALNLLAAKNVKVDEVWCLDLVNAGDSAILNTDHLGPAFDWMDVARDIANFILRYLPQYSFDNSTPSYPVQLPRLDVTPRNFLNLQGSKTGQTHAGSAWRGRANVLVGHSIGAASSASACSLLPEGLVTGLVLVDPTVQPLDIGGVDRVMPLVSGALMRRDLWASKEEALAGFKKNKGFFGRWHPEALSSYVDNALYQVDDGKVTLKMRGKHEAVTFLDPNLRGARACWNRLKYLPSSLRVHIVLASPDASVIQTRGITPERLLNELAATAPTYQQLFGIDHMIVQEAPQVIADTIANCLGSWLTRPSPKL